MPAEQINLQSWAEEFGIEHREFHIGHIRPTKRNACVGFRDEVNAEASALLGLLDAVGAGIEIRRIYHRLREPDELSPEERAILPEPALKYIEELEGELQELRPRNTIEPRTLCGGRTGHSR